MRTSLEVCVENSAGVVACVEGGADRIELCSALAVGGLTPSLGLMRFASRSGVPTYAMIRPRAGNFHFDADELDIMCADISAARECGLAGVVLGAADRTNALDVAALERLVVASAGMGRTLHRVIDLAPDPFEAIDQAVSLGFERILTAGQALAVSTGAPMLARMQAHARGRLEIMAGSGVAVENVGHLISTTGIAAYHSSCSCDVAFDTRLARFGFGHASERRTDPQKIRDLKAAIGAAPT